MIPIVLTLSIIATAFIFWGQLNNADIQIAPIFGVVFGALYSNEDFEDEREHVLQCCILCVSIQVIWATPNGLEK